jgi:hypothetical protein
MPAGGRTGGCVQRVDSASPGAGRRAGRGGRPVVGSAAAGARSRTAGGRREIRSRCRRTPPLCPSHHPRCRCHTRGRPRYRRCGRSWCRSRWYQERTVGRGRSPVDTPKGACHRPSSMLLPKLHSQHAATLRKTWLECVAARSPTRLSAPQFGQSQKARMPGERREIGFRAFSGPTDGRPRKALWPLHLDLFVLPRCSGRADEIGC